MDITETKSDGLRRELQVNVAAGELNQRLSEQLDDLKDKVRLKGFRPGKVPVAHLRKVYGRSVMAEVVQNTVNEGIQKVLSERDERPAYQPEISFTEDEKEMAAVISGDADLSYTISFEVLPTIELADFSKIKVERLVAEVTDEEVEKAVQRLLEGSRSYKVRAEGAAAEKGDRVRADYVGKIDGEAFEGGSAEDSFVLLEDGAFIPGFAEGLIGVKAGETRTVEATFPKDYGAKHLAGKVATFEVSVKEVGEPQSLELNDEFAQSMGLEDVDKLRKAVAHRLEEEYTDAARTKVKRAVLDALDEAHPIELPPTLVDQEFEGIWRQIQSELERSGRSFDDEDTTEDEARAKYRDIAERRVRLGLVLSEIGTRNEIKVTDEELNRALMERLRQFPGQEQQVYELYQKRPEALNELRAPIFEDKVVDFVLELAGVTEKTVTPDELVAPDTEEE